MALSFDILGGQYLEMIEALRKAFSQRSPALLEVTLSGTLNNKPRSVTVGIETSSPYYVKTINGHRLSATEESYANKPMPHPFNLTHIHAALGMSGAQRNEAEKKAFVSLIFITSEAARFEPFARHINTLIKADACGSSSAVPNTNKNTNTYTNINNNSYNNPNTNTDKYTNTNTDTYVYADKNKYTNTNTDTY